MPLHKSGLSAIVAILLVLMMTLAVGGVAHYWVAKVQQKSMGEVGAFQGYVLKKIISGLNIQDFAYDANNETMDITFKNTGATSVVIGDADIPDTIMISGCNFQLSSSNCNICPTTLAPTQAETFRIDVTQTPCASTFASGQSITLTSSIDSIASPSKTFVPEAITQCSMKLSSPADQSTTNTFVFYNYTLFNTGAGVDTFMLDSTTTGDRTEIWNAQETGIIQSITLSPGNASGETLTTWGYDPLPNNTINDIFCDSTYCYGAVVDGYITKVAIANGSVVWGTGGQEPPRPTTSNMQSIYCDSNFCYGGTSTGYFTKINLNGSIVWGTGGASAPLLASSPIYGIFCDSTYCYNIHGNGNFTKIAIANKSVVWGIGGAAPPTPFPSGSAVSSYDISCDSTYCYGSHEGGKVTKVAQNGSIIWGNTGQTAPSTGGWPNYGIECDGTDCYVAIANNVIGKVVIADGTVEWAGAGENIGPKTLNTYSSTSYATDIYCLQPYCYISHGTGQITKVAITNMTVVWGDNKITPPRPNSNKANALFCDLEYCFMGHSSGHFTKVRNSDGNDETATSIATTTFKLKHIVIESTGAQNATVYVTSSRCPTITAQDNVTTTKTVQP